MNNKSYHRTKYINVKYYFIKEYVKAEEVIFKYIPSKKNLADILTKLLVQEATKKINMELELQRSVEPGGVLDLGQYFSDTQEMVPKTIYQSHQLLSSTITPISITFTNYYQSLSTSTNQFLTTFTVDLAITML